MGNIPLDSLACWLNMELILSCEWFISINSQMSLKIILLSCSWRECLLLLATVVASLLYPIVLERVNSVSYLGILSFFSHVSCGIFFSVLVIFF